MAFEEFWWGPSLVGGPSLRFSGSQWLDRTVTAASNQKTWTFSAWVKWAQPSGVTVQQSVFDSYDGASSFFFRWSGTQPQCNIEYPGWVTSASYRDPGAWYHLVLVLDTTQAVANDRQRLYINGVQVTSYSSSSAYPQNSNQQVNAAGSAVNIGNTAWAATRPRTWNGYMSDVFLVDGTALSPTTFGYFNADGVWVPDDFDNVVTTVSGSGGFGANGFALRFEHKYFNSTGNVWSDQSGNGNNFIASWDCAVGVGAGSDILDDGAPDNFSTGNPLYGPVAGMGSPTFTYGNLGEQTGRLQIAQSTQAMGISGQYYAEFEVVSITNTDDYGIGIMAVDYARQTAGYSSTSQTLVMLAANGTLWTDASPAGQAGYASGYASGDVIGVAFDATNRTVQFYKNGVAAGAQVTGVSLKSAHVAWSGWSGGNPPATDTWIWNLGQLPFLYGPPLGFNALSSSTQPPVTVANGATGFKAIIASGANILGEASNGPLVAQSFFSAPGSWTAPAGITSINLQVVGGGGGGNSASPSWGGGGAGLAYDPAKIVVPGTTYPITIGSPGICPGNGGGSGSPGGTSSAFGLTGNGGAGGSGPNSPGGGASGGTFNYSGSPSSGGSQAGGLPGNYNNQSIYGISYFNPSNLGSGPWGAGGSGNAGQPAAVYNHGSGGAVLIQYPSGNGVNGFSTGLWWIKDRQNSNQHQLVDSVRGVSLALTLPGNSGTIFTQQEFPYVPPSGNSVAWCWATDATGLSVATGFQIVPYVGNLAPNRQISHSLGVTPGMVIVKDRDPNGTSQRWWVWHSSLATNNNLNLDSNSSQSLATGNVNGGLGNVTNTYFTLLDGPSNNNNVNRNGDKFISYVWAPVAGYSSFGSYVGNGNTDGVFVYTNMKPAYVIIKCISSNGDWEIYDNARNTYNPETLVLQADLTNSESTVDGIDFLSNGFKIRTTVGNINSSGQTYAYAAFAEHPFVGSNVSPVTAR